MAKTAKELLQEPGGQNVGDKFTDIIENSPSFFDTGNDTGEIVIRKNHVRSFFSHIGSPDSHGNSDIRSFSAGASLTPSPVTATILPMFFKALRYGICAQINSCKDHSPLSSSIK